MDSKNPNPGMMSPRKAMGHGKIPSGAADMPGDRMFAQRQIVPANGRTGEMADSARTGKDAGGPVPKDTSRREGYA